MNRLKIIIPCILSIIALISIDRITKKLAEHFLAKKEVVNIIGDYVILVYTKNRGGLLSFGHSVDDKIWLFLFIIIPLLVLIILSVYIVVNKSTQKIYLIVWVLIISGGLGNLIDRILYGEVVDFMNIGIGTFLRSGIFNVADLYIVFFIGIVIIRYITFYKKNGKFPDLL